MSMSIEEIGKRILTVSYIHQHGKKTPYIRLQGKWLLKSGFEAGSKIEVEVNNGLLCVKIICDDNTA